MPAPTEPRRRTDSASTPSARSTADETVAAGASAGAADVPGFGPPAAPGEVGTLGPYRIVKELGKGGMGAVYAALDTRLDRKLALKVMLPESAADAHAKERFLREARAAARVKHDNVVTVYEADERDGVPYIAMEFLDGYPLDEYLKRKGTPTVPQVVQIAAETASGLSAAHALGLVHRDIKPGNIWLEAPHGRVKVLDFGLARPMDAESELTRSGVVVGTPAYMSPEQARGQKVDHRADLFSLGALMYRLCAGRPPFQGPTTMAVLMALGTEEPPAVRDLNPTVPAALAALIHQLLAKPPEARPQSAAEVVNRLRAIAQELAAHPSGQAAQPRAPQPQVVYVTTPVTAAGDSPFADLDSPDTEHMSDEFDEPPADAPPPKSKTGGRLVWAGLAALVAVVGVVVAVRSAGGSKPTGATTPPPVDGGRGTGLTGTPTPAPADTDRAAAQWVIGQGGFVRVNGEDRSIPTVAELPPKPFALTLVGLTEMKVTDAGVSNLKGLKSLSYLVLWNTPVSDAALEHLTGLKAMSVLDLYGTQVTGAGLAHLRHCTGLMSLDLGGTQVGDAGLEHLKELKNLTYLSLSGDPVTDAGLARLKELKSLTRLDLGGTKVTAKGREELARALPGCKLEPLNPDRDVACDALRFGGTVRVNGLKRELTRPAELPKGAFALSSVTLSNTKIADAGLEVLTDLSGLTHLDLRDTAVSDAGLTHLRRLKGLEEMNLRGTQVSTKGVAALRAALPACRIVHDDDPLPPSEVDRATAKWAVAQGGTVRVDGERTDRKAADQLPKVPFALTHVFLNDTKVGDADLARLKDLKDLDWLDLRGTKVTEAGLKHVKGLTGLTLLNVQATTVSDAGVPALVELKNLKVLGLSGTAVTDAGLARLKELPQLALLELAGTKVTDAGLPHLAELKNLKLLDLEGTAVTDTGLEHLTRLGTLTGLDLRGTKVTDAGVARLKTMKALTELHLQKTGVTAKGLEELRAALPGCKINHDAGVIEPKESPDRAAAEWVFEQGGSVRINGGSRLLKSATGLRGAAFTLTYVNLSGTKVTDAGLARLKELTGLTSLGLIGTAVTDAGLAHLTGLDSLRTVDVRGTAVTDAGLEHLAKLKGLELLGLSETKVTDVGLRHLAALKGLKTLELIDTSVSDAGLAHLTAIKGLSELMLANAPVSDAGLKNLAELKNLKTLALDHTRVTDAGMRHLAELKNLAALGLASTAVTDTGLAHLTGLDALKTLDLRATAVTDAGVRHLAQLKGLTQLYLHKTAVTAKGLEALRGALPGCKIDHDGGTFEPKK